MVVKRPFVAFTILLLLAAFVPTGAMATYGSADKYSIFLLSAPQECINECGHYPNPRNLNASEAYQECVLSCHPAIEALQDQVDNLTINVENISIEVNYLENTVQDILNTFADVSNLFGVNSFFDVFTTIQGSLSGLQAQQQNLEGNMTDVNARLAAEEEMRAMADAALQSALDAEAAARTAVDAAEAAAREAQDAMLEGDIAAETAARESADAALQAALDAEVAARMSQLAAEEAKRIAADNAIAGAIEAGDNALQNSINTEIAARAALFNILRGEIETEAQERGASDVVLQIALDSEAAARAAADMALQAAMDAEAAARMAADSALMGALTSERDERLAAVGGLITEINVMSLQLDQADLRMAGLDVAIQTEVALREQADLGLEGALEGKIQEGDAALQAQLDTETQERQFREAELDVAIQSEVELREQGDLELEGSIGSETSDRKSADLELEGKLRGEYMAGDNVNMDAILELDEEFEYNKEQVNATLADAQSDIQSFFDVFTEVNGLFGVNSFFDVFASIKSSLQDLQNQISNIQLIPGPQGPAGPQGEPGPEGTCNCAVTLEEFNSLKARVDALEGGACVPTTETCNDIDDDCDGIADGPFLGGGSYYYVDWNGFQKYKGQGCGTGWCSGGVVICDTSYSLTCDTLGALSEEVCDSQDNDCDGQVDDGVCNECEPWEIDACGVCFGDGTSCLKPNGDTCSSGTECASGNCECTNPTCSGPGVCSAYGCVCQYVVNGLCSGNILVGVDDFSNSCGSMACDGFGSCLTSSCIPSTEYCDDEDNDCDGQTDENDAADAVTWHRDADSDGYGSTSSTATACSVPAGYVEDGTDCDDGDSLIHPGATEVCDAKDNDCDAQVDEYLTLSDPDNCGGCGFVCSLNNINVRSCTGGTCTSTCNAGFGDCNLDKRVDGCETNLMSDASNCGACSSVCSSNHVVSPACTSGQCTSACSSGWGDCNDNRKSDGCETSLTTLTNCGTCGITCSRANAAATCSTGACAIASCNQGFGNCDSNQANGCEYDLDTDPTCSNAYYLGAVSGDTGNDVITEYDHGERWYRFYVSEDDGSLSCMYLSASIYLTPPAGADYDLNVYCDGCTTQAGSSNLGGTQTDVVNVRWDEGCVLGFPSGTESGRYIYVQVAYYSGNTCSDYTLNVHGNTAVNSNTCSEL